MRKPAILLLLVLLTSCIALPDIVYAPADDNCAAFVTALNDSGLFDSVTYLDTRDTTPSLVDLQGYAAVITYSHYSYQNPTTFGNNIADYMDIGCSCVSTTFAHTSGWGLSGRYITDTSYSPFPMGSYGNPTVNMTDPTTHDIMDGVTSITGIDVHEYITTRTGATRLASLTDGYHLAAINAAENAVAVNLFPNTNVSGWTGDGFQLIINALEYLIETQMPKLTSVVAAGDTVTLSFDRDTNEPTIDETNIDTVFALDDGTRNPALGEIRATSVHGNPNAPHSWLSGNGSLGGAVWTDAATLEVTLSDAGGAPTIAVGDTVTCDGETVQLVDVDNPSSSESTVTGEISFNIVETSWGALKVDQ